MTRIFARLAGAVSAVALATSTFGPAIAENLMSVKVSHSGETSVTKHLLLPKNKSSVIELDRPAADVIIANPEIAEAIARTPKRLIFRGLKTGETNAFFFDQHGNQMLDLQIQVEQDLAGLHELFKRYIPDARIQAEAVNGGIILTGRVANLSESNRAVQLAETFIVSDDASAAAANPLAGAGGAAAAEPSKIMNLLTVEGKEQVLLKVRIVEMQRTVVKQLGINVTQTQTFGEFAPPVGAVSDQVAPDGSPILEIVEPGQFPSSATTSASNAFSVAGRALGGLALTGAFQNFVGPRGAEVLQSSVGGTLNALERVGLIRTLAEPNLVAISGEAAKFLAGGEYPVPVGEDQDGNIKLEFKPFGVGLGFTPVVLSEGRISLRISTEVSELTTEGAFQPTSIAGIDGDGNVITAQTLNIPALNVRRVESTVEMPSGGSMVIAGLIQEQTRQSLDAIPGVKDLPILGALFRSRDFQNSETELVVIVTPYLVDPTDPRKFRTPDEGFQSASDLATVFLGKINKIYGVPGADTSGESFEAPVGFIIE